MRTKRTRTTHSRRTLLAERLEERLALSITPLTGDYSGSNSVGTEDYQIWRSTYGSTTDLRADGNSDGVIDAADYSVWRDNLGATRTPEPFLNLVVESLGEGEETAPGAIIFRNSDFSKESLFSIQPESGLPLYQPDYLADSSIYDPNAAQDYATGSLRIDQSMLGDYNLTITYDDTDIRLWTTTVWPGMTAVGGGRWQIPSGALLTPDTVHLDFQIEGLESSDNFATSTIDIQGISMSTGPALTDSVTYTVVDTSIGVDGNRDTKIDFANSHDRQLLFWLNNDQEGQGDFEWTDPSAQAYEADVTPITTPDNQDGQIGQRRDLEDLAPLRFIFDPLLVDNTFNTADPGAPGAGQLSTTYSLSLENGGGSTIRLFNANSDAGNVLEHVKDEFVASVQGEDAFWTQAIGPDFAARQDLSNLDGGLNAYLFEALGGLYGLGFTAMPTLTLTTTVEYGNGRTSTKRHEVELDLRDIKQLYTRWSIDATGSMGEDLRKTLPFADFATPAAPIHQSQVTDAPFWSGDDTVVWVHGWNVDGATNNDRKASNAETVLKRLYWEGFRGEFVSFDWPTFVNSEGPREIEEFNFTYNPSDLQAWRSANALKEILASYRGPDTDLQPVHLIAHSMGNVVAGEALRQWTYDVPLNNEPLVTSYTAMMAAISAGAYGDNGTENLTFSLRLDLYRYFEHGRNPPGDNGILPLFVGAGFAAEKRINFYNEDDRALSAWDFNNNNKMDNFDVADSTIWDFNYDWTPGDGENINNDLFERLDESVDPVVRTPLDLADAASRPGPDAYEILAFFARSGARALGTKPVTAFDSNLDLELYTLPGGSERGANHSYQYHHDAAETSELWADVVSEAGIFSTFATPPICVDPPALQTIGSDETESPLFPPRPLPNRSPAKIPTGVAASDSVATPIVDNNYLLLLEAAFSVLPDEPTESTVYLPDVKEDDDPEEAHTADRLIEEAFAALAVS